MNIMIINKIKYYNVTQRNNVQSSKELNPRGKKKEKTKKE
jgi:hypothetical protein